MNNNKTKQYLSLLFIIIMIGLTSYLVLKDHSLETIMKIIKSVNPVYLYLGLGMMFIFVTCEAINTFSLLRVFKEKVSFLSCLGFAFVGFYFSSITPSSSGGQPAQLFYMNKAKINLSYASLNLLLITMFYQLVMILYAIVLFCFKYQFILEHLSGVKYFLIFSVLINMIIICIILMAMFSKKLIYRLINQLTMVLAKLRIIKDIPQFQQNIVNLVKDYMNGAIYIRQHPMVIIRMVFIIIIQLTAMYLIPYFVYKAFNLSNYSLLEILTCQAILSLATSAIPLPGAVGASENLFLNVFRLFFPGQLLVPAMLLTRGISFYIFLIISGIVSLIVHISLSCRREHKHNA